MNNNIVFTEQAVKDAAVWNKRASHDAVMEKLKTIGYKETVHVIEEDMGDYYAGEQFVHYDVKYPPVKELLEIAERGEHDEIMFMISQFHKLYDFDQTHYDGYIPGAIQDFLVKRNNPEEIAAVTRRYGFCESAQMLILELWPHAQVMTYIRQHGFSLDGQKYILENWSDEDIALYVKFHGLGCNAMKTLIAKGNHEHIMTQIEAHGLDFFVFSELFQRGNHDEIMAALMKPKKRYDLRADDLHQIILRGEHDEIMAAMKIVWSSDFKDESQIAVWKRGYNDEITQMFQIVDVPCDEILNDIFVDIENGKSNAYFAAFAANTRTGLPVDYQIRFIRAASSEDFLFYTSHQGLYENVLFLLVSVRDAADVRGYLEKHCYLSSDAEWVLAANGTREDKLYYYQHYCGQNYGHEAFLTKLLTVRPLDVSLISQILLSLSERRHFGDDNEVELMRTGGKEEIIEYFNSQNILCLKAFQALFFRMDAELLELYLDSRYSSDREKLKYYH